MFTTKNINLKTSFSLFILSSLYPSVLSSWMPTGPFYLCSPNQRPTEFALVSQALLSNDITFFHDQLHVFGNLYFCEVQTSFHPRAPLNFLNFELSSQPFPYATPPDSLSPEQRAEMKSKNNTEKKLCSFLKDENFVSNWGEVLVYECAIHDLIIKKVIKIIRCKASKLFNPWISKLQNQKNVIPSAFLVKVVKQISNSLPVCGIPPFSFLSAVSTSTQREREKESDLSTERLKG